RAMVRDQREVHAAIRTRGCLQLAFVTADTLRDRNQLTPSIARVARRDRLPFAARGPERSWQARRSAWTREQPHAPGAIRNQARCLEVALVSVGNDFFGLAQRRHPFAFDVHRDLDRTRFVDAGTAGDQEPDVLAPVLRRFVPCDPDPIL